MGESVIVATEALAQMWVKYLKEAGYNADYRPVQSSGNRSPQATGSGFMVMTWGLKTSRPNSLRHDSLPGYWFDLETMAEKSSASGTTYLLRDTGSSNKYLRYEFQDTSDLDFAEAMVAAGTGGLVGGINIPRAAADTVISLGSLGTENEYFGPVKIKGLQTASNVSYGSARVGTESLAAAGTAGLSYAPQVVQTINFMQFSRASVGMYENAADTWENGPTLGNQLGFAASAAGAVGFFKPAFSPNGISVPTINTNNTAENFLRNANSLGMPESTIAAEANAMGKVGLPTLSRNSANPFGIRFSQSTVSPNFSSGGTINDTVSALKSGTIGPNDIPAIRVVEYQGQLYTLDNRRLLAFQFSGVDEIPIQQLQLTDPAVMKEFFRKLNPIDGGTKIVVVPSKGRAAAEAVLREHGKIK